MELDCLPFNEDWLESLDPQSMQCGRAIQQHGMFADHLGENIPHLGGLLLYHLLRGLDRCGKPTCFQLPEDERLEQFEGHLLR